MGPEQICHGGFWLDICPLLERPERVVDQPVQGHGPCLGHDDFNGGLARGRVLREHRDDEKEQQLAFGTEHRVKAPTGAVKSLERPEEAFHRVGGRGEAGTPHATDELGQLGLHRADPWGNPPRRGTSRPPRPASRYRPSSGRWRGSTNPTINAPCGDAWREVLL